MRTCLWILLTCAALPSASAQDLSKNAKAKRALDAASDELQKFAKVCIANNDYSHARDEFQRAFALSGSKKFRDEARKVPSKPDAPKTEFAAAFPEERSKVHQKCCDLIVEAALASLKDGKADVFESLMRLAGRNVPSDEAFKRADLVYFEPYLAWVTKEDAQRLEAGDEFVGGKWLPAATVRELDQKHAGWDDPWVIADEVHEVHTPLPLRTARQVLAHAGAFRAFFLRQFEGLWDLRAPAGKLPIFFTGTKAEMMEVARKEMSRRGSSFDESKYSSGEAFYLRHFRSLNPCFVSLENLDPKFNLVKVPFGRVLWKLRHEVTHQLAYEYSCFNADLTARTRFHFWVIEGLARFMEHFDSFQGGEWTLSNDRACFSMGDVGYYTAWGQTFDNRKTLPTLAAFDAQETGEDSLDSKEVDIGATLVYFFLKGEHGKYAARFTKLMEMAHRHEEKQTSFEECFRGTAPDKIQAEWAQFVDGLRLK